MGCGCAERQAALNGWRPGLGDRVKVVAEPVAELAPLLLGAVLLYYVWRRQ